MNLFDLYENREPYQQAIDKLEQRRIEDLEAKMDDYAQRGMKDEFQKCKAERDSYHKIKETHDTTQKNSQGHTTGFSHEGDWKKIPKNKAGRPVDPRGEVTHLSDRARREAERAAQADVAEAKYEIHQHDPQGKLIAIHHRGHEYGDDVIRKDTRYKQKNNPRHAFKVFKDKEPFDWQDVAEGAGEFLYKKLRPSQYGGVDVVGFKQAPRNSVLSGQVLKHFIDSYETEEEARKAHPDAEGYSNKYTDPQVSLSHLPGEDDPVSGGMYPDDIDEQDMSEGDNSSPVAGAIVNRIMRQRPDLLTQYGPKLINAAVDEVADYVGDVDEIGSSDVSGWVNQVERMLKENPPEAFAEGGIGQDLVTPQQRVQGAKSQKQTPTGKVVDTVKQAGKWLAGKGGPGKEGPTYEGKDDAWQEETPWTETPKNKAGKSVDPRGEVTHLSDVARRKAEMQSQVKSAIAADRIQKKIQSVMQAKAQKKNSEPVDEGSWGGSGPGGLLTPYAVYTKQNGQVKRVKSTNKFGRPMNPREAEAYVAAMRKRDPARWTHDTVWIAPADVDLGEAANPAQQAAIAIAMKKAGKKPKSVDEGAMSSVHAAMADVYHRLAPGIERNRDSFKAGQLYDELENIAELHGIEPEFKRMMNTARNRAHMEYDTNPGGFQNWFWFLPFGDEIDEGMYDTLGENQDTSGVESAIIRRIMVAHKDWLVKFGPQKVMQAAEEVAYNVGDVDEIGTSDVSAYVREVAQILGVEA